MLTLLLSGIAVVILISGFIIIINNRPDFWFWLFLNLYFDPGGYVEGLFDGNLIGPLTTADVFITGILFCIISARINWEGIFSDKFLLKFLIILFFYTLYYFIVYGGIIPLLHDDLNYSTFLIKNRNFVYSLIILVGVYAFSLRSLKYFYIITLIIGIICLSFYLITLSTGFNLIPVWDIEREGTEMSRLILISYGLFNIIFPLSLIVYILSKKFAIKLNFLPLLYIGGAFMVITEVLTLTRRVQIDIIGTLILIILIISYLLRTSKLKEILKLISPAVLIILILFLTAPQYTGYAAETAEDTFLLLFTGKDSRGISDQRVTGAGEYELVKEYIGNNLLFGNGYSQMTWVGRGNVTTTRGNTFARVSDAAAEVPIYYLLFGFGIAGAIIILSLYFFMAKLFFNLIKLLRLNIINYLHKPLTIIYSLYFLLIIAKIFTYHIWGLGEGFFIASISYTAVLAGLGFSLYRKLFLNHQIKNINNF